jgi:PAS domain S-box-containing protein
MTAINQAQFPGQTILQSIPELAYVFNAQGKMVMWNKNILAIMGYSEKEIVDIPVTGFIAEPFREEVERVFQAVLNDEESHTVEYELVTKTGEHLPYIGTGQRITVNKEYFVVGQAINIEKLKDVQKDLKGRLTEINALKEALELENSYLRTQVKISTTYPELVGMSNNFKRTIQQVEQTTSNLSTVLIYGDSGTGKTLYAKTIHNHSTLRNSAFVSVNCLTISKTIHLVDLCDSATNGTLFFENINELSPKLQSDLICLLKEGRMGIEPRFPKRIIASTQSNLEEMILNDQFREDLFFYLNVMPIKLAALKDRLGDIPELTQHFIKMYNQKHGKKVEKITIAAMRRLQQYDWPGNVRELENVVERAVLISPAKKLIIESLSVLEFVKEQKFQTLSELEKNHILTVLKFTKGRVDGSKGAAVILGLHAETLRSRMRKLDIKRVNI